MRYCILFCLFIFGLKLNAQTEILFSGLDNVERISANTGCIADSVKHVYYHNYPDSSLGDKIITTQLDTLYEEVRFRYNHDDEAWVFAYKTYFTLDQFGNQNYSESYTWNSDSNRWDGSGLHISNYNTQGNLILNEMYRWDMETKDFSDALMKFEIEYNSFNEILKEYYYRPTHTSDVWKLTGIAECFYTADNKKDSVTVKYLSSSDSWDLNSYINYRYTDTADVITKTQYIQHVDLWGATQQTVLTYDNNGFESSDSYFEKSYVDTVWTPKQRFDYVNDNSGNQTYITESYWSGMGYWIPRNKEEQGFDNTGLLITNNTFYRAGGLDGYWIPYARNSYAYNNNACLTIETTHISDVEGAEFKLNRKLFYYYPFVEVEPNMNKAIWAQASTLTPNPSHGLIQINSERPVQRIEIVNLNGQVVYAQQGGSETLNIDLGNQQPGMYIVGIYYSDNTISRAKLVLTK